MHRQWWKTLVMILLAVASVAGPLTGAHKTAHAAALPLVFLKDGDIWSWNGSTVTQLTTWGYNERPVLSPGGKQIAYNSWAQITVDAIATGQPAFGFIPSNIWVMDTQTGDAFRAADQPAGAVYAPNGEQNNVVMRGTPGWSPDGSKIAWSELLVPESRYQLVVFDVASRSSRVLVQTLPSPFGDGGFVPVHGVEWGSTGIAVVNVAVNGPSGEFEERLYLYDPNTGVLLSDTLIGSSATEFSFHRAWTTYNGQEYYGVLYPSGRRFLIDARTSAQQDMPALPELYTPFAAQNSATAFIAASIDSASNLTKTWTAVYPSRTQDQLLSFTGEPWNITVSPEGQSLAYFSDALYVWQNGQVTQVPGTQGVASPWDVAVVWGPTAWRVRTDWPGGDGGAGSGGMGGGGFCSPAPRLSRGGSGQVTPGLPNLIRTQPRRGADSVILGQIPGTGVFSVLDGPVCDSEGRYWWQVTYQGITGWTPEGEGGFYWLQPYGTTPPPACTLAPRLTIGSTAYVLPGLPNLIRSQPRRGAGSAILGQIPGSGIFTVTGGPQCDSEGRYWWQVNYRGIVGWTAEGESATYWVAPFGCPASPAPRLAPGMVARVTPGLPNRLRSGPGSNYGEISQIPGTGVFTVLSGPQCGPEGWSYWRVQYGGLIGWTAEGDGGVYWLEPVGIVPPPNPTPPPPVVCSPAPRLQVGVAGQVLPGLPNVLRSQPRRGSDSAILTEMAGGSIFSVIGGPVCGPEGHYWWQVQFGALTGWTPEGEGSTYWVQPYPGDGPPSGVCTLQSRLTPGASAYVIPGPANVIRNQPTRGGTSQVVGQIPGGDWFRVISGPQCDAEGIAWWQVNYQGVTGWTGESQGTNYWVAPFVCTTSGPARLMPGISARVTPGAPNVVRSAPGTGSNSVVVGEIPGGGVFSVIGGPQCGNDNRIWWQVNYQGLVGWTAEGERGVYWVEPLQ